jgi:GT2 family glycosyltransferase
MKRSTLSSGPTALSNLLSRFAQRWRAIAGQPSYAVLKNDRVAWQRGREVDVVICVHNALNYVKQCLASVLATRGARHRIIVVNDASQPEVGAYLGDLSGRYERLLVCSNATRLGYCKCANVGIRLSSADFVILLNSDTVVAPNWIEKLCDAIYTTEGAGIVGPLSNAASFQSIPDHRSTAFQTPVNRLPPGLTVEDLDLHCETWTSGTDLPRVPLVHGFCFGVRRPVIDSIGLFDETLFQDGFGEEDDYCLRAGEAGIGLVVATHTYVFHAKTKSYSLAARHALTTAAEQALRTRHGNERVERAIETLNANSVLCRFRREASTLYAKLES